MSRGGFEPRIEDVVQFKYIGEGVGGGGGHGGGGADLNQELKILLDLIKNSLEVWGGLYNLKKIN